MQLNVITPIIVCFFCGIHQLEGRKGDYAKPYKRPQKRRQSVADASKRVKIFNAKLKHQQFPANVITKDPTNMIQCKIFSRSGYHLEILPSGVVRGTVEQGSKFVLFEMQSFGPSVVKLRSNATGRYLTMRRDGSLRGVRHSHGKDSLFKETHEENAFHSYASNRYFKEEPYDMLVAIKRNGQIKRATKTIAGQTSTQFLVIKFPRGPGTTRPDIIKSANQRPR